MTTIEENISLSIKKNGFPDNKVRLPFRKIYESCKRENLKLADVLKNLENQGISSQIEEEKILFFNKNFVVNEQSTEPFSAGNSGLFGVAMEQMKSMDPKILDEIKQKVMNMSPKERSEILTKAKNLKK